jgi:hypothetical protein
MQELSRELCIIDDRNGPRTAFRTFLLRLSEDAEQFERDERLLNATPHIADITDAAKISVGHSYN